MSEKFRKKMIFDVAGDSHPGLVRSRNEDAFLYAYNRDVSCFLAAVADGIGGGANGDLASSLLLKSLFAEWRKTDSGAFRSMEDVGKFLCDRIQTINSGIFAVNQKYQHSNPMGTTIALLAFRKDEFLVMHAGDSRCSLFRDGGLIPLTHDHTLLNFYLDSGKIHSEAEMDPSLIHVITRSIGPEAFLKLDSMIYSRRPGDRFLICSDGVPLHLSDPEIGKETADAADAESCLKNLSRKILVRGARDNFTIICIWS